MRIIKKKIWPKYFKQIQSGKKKFELRLADFKIIEGDILILEEWNPKKEKYTGRKIKVVVDYILKTQGLDFWSKEKIDKYGLQIIQFKIKN